MTDNSFQLNDILSSVIKYCIFSKILRARTVQLPCSFATCSWISRRNKCVKTIARMRIQLAPAYLGSAMLTLVTYTYRQPESPRQRP